MAEIVRTDGVMGGQPRIEGRRISVLQIVEWTLEEELAPETVAAEFDLDLGDVYRALAYYYDNGEEMTERRKRRRRRIEAGKASALDPDAVTRTA